MTVRATGVACVMTAVTGLAMLGACAGARGGEGRPTSRLGLVTMRGNPVTLEGTSSGVRIGELAPEFTAIANDMSERSLSAYRGKAVILSTVPSLETAVCDLETRTFNERAAALGEGVVVVTVSMDLPFTQKKWCAAAGIDRVETLSDSRLRQVGDRYGLRIRENGLLTRSVTVIDGEGIVRYQEIVAEVTQEPDYDSAIAAARAASGAN